jgi:hypothetical protein
MWNVANNASRRQQVFRKKGERQLRQLDTDLGLFRLFSDDCRPPRQVLADNKTHRTSLIFKDYHNQKKQKSDLKKKEHN